MSGSPSSRSRSHPVRLSSDAIYTRKTANSAPSLHSSIAPRFLHRPTSHSAELHCARASEIRHTHRLQPTQSQSATRALSMNGLMVTRYVRPRHSLRRRASLSILISASQRAVDRPRALNDRSSLRAGSESASEGTALLEHRTARAQHCKSTDHRRLVHVARESAACLANAKIEFACEPAKKTRTGQRLFLPHVRVAQKP